MEQSYKYKFEEVSLEEKIRLFTGDGSWKSYSAGGVLPHFVMSDGPHGLRKQDEENYADLNKSKVATCFPTASCIASSWNRESLQELGEAIGKEAVFEHVNMVLGPGINIKRSPLCGRNFEYYSEDPYLSGTLAASYINGMQKLGVGACLKHFACNNQETRRQTSNSIIDERTLREIYLRGFEIAVKESAPMGIMGSYNRLNGEYTCASKKLLTDILRNEWGYKGIVISDWGACIDAAKCAKAGMNLAMPDSGPYLSNALKKALAGGIISESQIEQTVEPVVDTAAKFIGYTPEEKVDYDRQHQIAKKLAGDSAVLLKNDDILPLKPGKIVVIGELALKMKFQGGGSSHITTKEYPNAVESLKALGYDVVYFDGKKDCNFSNIADNVPVLVFTGLTEKYEGEGFDRTTLALPEEQLTLLSKVLSVRSNVITINFSGAPVDFTPLQGAKAILQMYLCGEACGEAVADIVSGVVNPSGKLAETIPCKIEDTPCYGNFALSEDNILYKEGVFVGYRHYESKNIPVQYEFGYGLSYTTFEYSDMAVEIAGNGCTVNLSVTNTGKYDGSETVQIYVSPVQNDVETALRPVIELRGFEKVKVESGKTIKLSIKLDDLAFKVFSSAKNEFVTIGGKYVIKAGASVKDIRLEKTVEITGEGLQNHTAKIEEDFYKNNSVVAHSKGNFTISDSLGDMAKESRFIRGVLKVLVFAVILMNKGKSKEDPAVKIAISAIVENPLESLISTSGGAITEKTARWFLKKANK